MVGGCRWSVVIRNLDLRSSPTNDHRPSIIFQLGRTRRHGGGQTVRSGTAVAASYLEARDAESRSDICLEIISKDRHGIGQNRASDSVDTTDHRSFFSRLKMHG